MARRNGTVFCLILALALALSGQVAIGSDLPEANHLLAAGVEERFELQPDEVHSFRVTDPGGGLVTVRAERAATLLEVQGQVHAPSGIDFQWAWLTDNVDSIHVSTTEAGRPTPYRIHYLPRASLPTGAEALRASTSAARLNDDQSTDRQRAIALNVQALRDWPEGMLTAHLLALHMRQSDLLRRELDFEAAIEHATRALDLSRTLADETLPESWIWNEIGAIYNQQDRYTEAEAAFCRSFNAAATLPDCSVASVQSTIFEDGYWPGRSAMFMGLLEHHRGRLGSASDWYRTAQALTPSWADDIHGLLINNLGGVAFMRGDHESALASFNEVRRAALEAGNYHQVGMALGNMAAVHMMTGQIDQAIEHFRQSLDYRRSEHDKNEAAHIEYQIGSLYLKLGNRRSAAHFLEKSYDIRQRNQLSGLGGSALRLGSLRREEEKPDEAIELHREAFQEFARIGDGDGQFEALIEQARDYLTTGDREQLDRVLVDAAALLPDVEDLRLYGRYYYLLGISSATPADAIAAYQQALHYDRLIDDAFAQIDTLYQIAISQERVGDVAAAMTTLDEAIATLERSRLGVANHSLRANFTGAHMDVYSRKINLLIAAGDADGALQLALGNRTRVLFESLVYDGDRGDDALEVRARALRTELAAKSEARRRIAERWPDGSALAEIEVELADIVNELDTLESRLMSGRIGQLPELSAAELGALIPHDALLVVHWLGEHRSWRWEVRPDTAVVTELPGRSVLARDIGALRDEVRDARRQTPDSGVLTAQLLGNTDLGQFRRIFVVPDGVTALVPWAALTVEGSPLIEQAPVTVIPGAAMLVERPATQASRSALILSDPVFGRDDPRGNPGMPASSFPRLVFSGPEAESVHEALHGGGFDVTDLRGYAASKQNLLDQAAQAGVIHLATHGVADNAYPETSGLQFASVTESGEPITGLLSLSEIYGLDLQADLVVLSACDTATGFEVAGEGPISLARGFLIGGAQQVIASLWPVDDAATRELMALFYTAWIDGRSPSAALQIAQQTLATRGRFSGPRYWGAFVLVGAAETNRSSEASSRRDIPKTTQEINHALL